MEAGTPEETEKAYMHIRHALLAEAKRSTKTAFGVNGAVSDARREDSLKVLDKFEIPEQIIKMIAEALHSRDALWALMDTNPIIRRALKPIVLPREWVKPRKFIDDAGFPHVDKWGSDDGLVAYPNIQVFLIANDDKWWRDDDELMMMMSKGAEIPGSQPKRYIKYPYPEKYEIPVYVNTTLHEVFEMIKKKTPEAEGARFAVYRSTNEGPHVIKRALRAVDAEGMDISSLPVVKALAHVHDTLWIDVFVAEKFRSADAVKAFMRRKGWSEEKISESETSRECNRFRYIQDTALDNDYEDGTDLNEYTAYNA